MEEAPPVDPLPNHDLDILRRRLSGLIGSELSANALSLAYHGSPTSKLRSRAYFREFVEYLRSVGAEPFAGNVAVIAEFYRPNLQRIDADNLMKLVLDAGTAAGVWRDDCQVTAHAALIELDSDNPRTLVVVSEYRSTMVRGRDAQVPCQSCGKLFMPSGRTRRTAITHWCSRECRTVLAALVACPFCGRSFRRRSRYSKFCSVVCRSEFHSERRRLDRRARTHCRNGHELDERNCLTTLTGLRRCRRCGANNAINLRSKKKALLHEPAR